MTAGRLAAAVAGITVIVAAALVWQVAWRPSRIGADITEPIRSAMIAFSNGGPLVVLPGTEGDLVTVNAPYRSGPAMASQTASRAVYALSEYDQNDRGSRELYFWKISGYLTTGDFASALAVAGQGWERFPDDAEIGTLCALAEYFGNLPGDAEVLLRTVLERHPDYGVAEVNLGIILAERGNDREARDVFSRVVKRHPGTALAVRANALMARLE